MKKYEIQSVKIDGRIYKTVIAVYLYILIDMIRKTGVPFMRLLQHFQRIIEIYSFIRFAYSNFSDFTFLKQEKGTF